LFDILNRDAFRPGHRLTSAGSIFYDVQYIESMFRILNRASAMATNPEGRDEAMMGARQRAAAARLILPLMRRYPKEQTKARHP
jgi:hypothetical protein